MKKLLLLGAISPFCDLVIEMKALDYEPVICDYYEDAPAKYMGYKSYDASTTDVATIQHIARKELVDGCVSAYSDRNILPCQEVCDSIGSRYFFNREIAECLIDKQLMKSFFADINVPMVKYGVVDVGNLEEAIKDFQFPVVTKPLDAYGSKGIFVCHSPDEVFEQYKKTLNESLNYSDRIIIEEYYDADEISVTAWVKNGIAYITCIYDVFRNTTNDITLSGVSFPSKYTSEYLSEISELLNYIVSKRGIVEGPVTLQCFIGNRGLKVSELLCRLAGGSPYLYGTYLGGPNIAKMLIQYAAGDPIDYQNLEVFSPNLSNNDVFYDIQVLINQKGIIDYKLDLDQIKASVPEIIDLRIYYNNKAELKNVSSGGVTFAKVICKTERKKDYFSLIERLDKTICVYSGSGEKISFIRKPEEINVTDIYAL